METKASREASFKSAYRPYETSAILERLSTYDKCVRFIYAIYTHTPAWLIIIIHSDFDKITVVLWIKTHINQVSKRLVCTFRGRLTNYNYVSYYRHCKSISCRKRKE